MPVSSELDEIQAIFFEECTEGLATAEEGLSEMAAGDTSLDTINKVFRAVHSIKGGSGAFGHQALLAFSHSFENVLDGVRSGKIDPVPTVVKLLLSASDILSDHVRAAQEGSPPPSDASVLEQLDTVFANQGAEPEAPCPAPASDEADEFGFTPVAVQPDMLDEPDPFGFAPVTVSLDDVVLERPAAEWAVIFKPSRAAMANGSEPLLVVRELERLGGKVHEAKYEALPPLRELDAAEGYISWLLFVPGEIAEAELRECFDFVAPDSVVEISRNEPAAVSYVCSDKPQVDSGEEGVERPALKLVDQSGSTVAAAPKQERSSEAPSLTIRVDLTKLDQLLNLVGELVIRNSILADRLSPADKERVELPQLSRLTRQIQDSVMSLRAQPIRQAFSRVPRMLRDLSAATGKQVMLEVSGEATEVDKTLIEKIGDPLTHLIRNAVDHGLETPEERKAAGKAPEGVIRLSAEQKGGRILVRVADDGKGIDRERVRAKAVEKGIVAADAVLSNEDIDQLICAPGFSTAETISNISGRGVGMDVVRSNIEALGGRVEITSVPGEGTTFTLVLPLTLAILDGMIVRLGDQRFVLPLASVIESVRPEPGQVHSMTPDNEVIELRGSYLPVRRLTDVFGIRTKHSRAPEESLVVVVESETAGMVGLMVDTIDDRREVVIKSLDENLYPIRGLGGATVLGDGSIALILDLEALVTAPVSQPLNLKGLAA
jgi:two-component system chemotaxis sensor kinase CheA